MLRFFIALLFLSACSTHTKESGGEDRYVYQPEKEYNLDDLKELSPQIIRTMKRDTPDAKVDDLFSRDKRDIKKVAIVVFESIIQPTYSGLANEDKIFLSAQGKQLLTEKFLSIWEKSFSFFGDEIQYVPTIIVKKSSVFQRAGLEVEDEIKVQRVALAPDDVFFLEKGQKTTLSTILNPRGMRDLSMLLVPAAEIMEGPKWSEHAKHLINDISKEMELDAVIVVMSNIQWTAERIDKHTGEFIPEEMRMKLKSSVLIPLTQYHERLKSLGKNEKPNITACYRYYEADLKIPISISVPPEEMSFETAEKKLVNPLLKTYNDLTQMTLFQLINDLKATH